MKLDRKHLLIIGGGVALVLIYLYYRNSQSSSSATDTGTSDTLGAVSTDPYSGYDPNAAGGGVDTSGLETTSGEASDISGLQSQVSSEQAQETSDVSGINASIAGLGGEIDALGTYLEYATPAQQSTQAAVAAGKKKAPYGGLHGKVVGPGGGYIKLPGNNDIYVGASGKHVTAKQAGIKLKSESRTSTKTNNASHGHTNANHPKGTAGHAVAQRSHKARKA